MSFLRVGTACAVFDDAGRILLSRRGDLNLWNLPTGRLDAHEALPTASAREAREETGVIVTIERMVGLYYFQATRRLNVLYAAFPVGGHVVDETDESTANQYFPLGALPQGTFAGYMAHHAADDARKVLYIHTTPLWQAMRLRLKLGQRWLQNWLQGRPEPRHVRFEVCAVAVLWDEPHRRVLTVPGDRERVLPYVPCTGEHAPWVTLAHGLRRWLGVAPALHWVGVWQDVAENAIELVFAATVDATQLTAHVEWTDAQNGALLGRDAAYVRRISATYAQDRVWSIIEADDPVSQIYSSTEPDGA